MSNGEVCCLLGICCPPAQRRKAIRTFITSHGCPDNYADELSQALDDEFDFAEKGTLQPLVDAVVKHAHKSK